MWEFHLVVSQATLLRQYMYGLIIGARTPYLRKELPRLAKILNKDVWNVERACKDFNEKYQADLKVYTNPFYDFRGHIDKFLDGGDLKTLQSYIEKHIKKQID